MYRLSRCVLLAHEDKLFQGAMIASLSIPWGARPRATTRSAAIIWSGRADLVQSATALLATRDKALHRCAR